MKTDTPPEPEEKPEKAIAQLEAEITELRSWLRIAEEEEERLEAQLEPLRKRLAKRG